MTETSFNPTAKFEEAFIERKKMEYSYNDGDLYYFMDQETYDMIPLSKEICCRMPSSSSRRTRSARSCRYKGNVFGVECPNFVELVVTSRLTRPFPATPPRTRLKPATLETGAEIKVPLFIDEGEKIQRRYPHRRIPGPREISFQNKLLTRTATKP